MISNLSFKDLIDKRRKNYNYLYNKLSKIKEIKIPFKLEEGIVPFGFVILTKKRNKLYEYCINQNIYCNIHWRDTINKLSNFIITIPCDQRYGEIEMEQIVERITNFFRS